MITIYVEGGATIGLATDDRAEEIISAWKAGSAIIAIDGRERTPKITHPSVEYLAAARIIRVIVEEPLGLQFEPQEELEE